MENRGDSDSLQDEALGVVVVEVVCKVAEDVSTTKSVGRRIVEVDEG